MSASRTVERSLAAAEPPVEFWRDPASYDTALRERAAALAGAGGADGAVPRELQVAALARLHWYFTVDARERAPTVVVDEAMARVFHERVRDLMSRIEPDAIAAFHGAGVEVRHALLSYRAPTLACGATVDAYDHRQGLARVSYWIHGEPPAEALLVDGREVRPAFEKLRACNYFRRRLLRQRIAWVDVAQARSLRLWLDGREVALGLGAQPFAFAPDAPADAAAGDGLAARVRAFFPPGKGGQQPLPPGPAGWKVRLVKALARSAPVRRLYGRSWAFIDREEDAGDNAEHLYRWVRRHHPEVNAWFMLRRDSPDWPRLEAEGFRLMPPGARRKLMLLNAEHIVSSHAEWVFGGFDRRLFGDAMQWRYTFLQHGVIMNDLSHWLGPREFDCFVTSGPEEHRSVAGDDTAYPYTGREVRRTGLPRHDRLLRLACQRVEPNCLLVMPTWRASLVGSRGAGSFAESQFAQRWRSVLCDESLHALSRRAGLRLVFFPHRNLLPLLPALNLPAEVEIATDAQGGLQAALARSAAFITDYTSVAFDAAFLRVPVFYYQFDREAFYGGTHNWRQGYFDYERDGFGPVAVDESALLQQLRTFVEGGCRPDPSYRERMERAMPDRDTGACRRVYDAIRGLDRPGAAALRGESGQLRNDRS